MLIRKGKEVQEEDKYSSQKEKEKYKITKQEKIQKLHVTHNPPISRNNGEWDSFERRKNQSPEGYIINY